MYNVPGAHNKIVKVKVLAFYIIHMYVNVSTKMVPVY
jgi:hypothetical protein